MHNNRDGIESQRERDQKKKGTARVPPPNSPPLSTTIAAQTKSIVSATTQSKEPKTQLNNKEKGREPLRQLRRNHIFA